MQIRDAGCLFAEQVAASSNVLYLAQEAHKSSFDDAIMTVIDRFIVVDHFSAFLNPAGGTACFIAAGSRDRDDVSSRIARSYAAHFFQCDPLPPAIAHASGREVVLLSCLRSSELLDARYRHECYDKPDIAERLSVSSCLDEGWLTLHLYRTRKRPSFDADDMSRAVRAAACIFPVLSYRRRSAGGDDRGPRATLAAFAARLAALPCRLSRREIEVCARALIGMTVEGTALDLDIAVTSVATYRKRAYQRLGISSLNELFAVLPDNRSSAM